jgi:hypothetical protein
MDLYGPVVKVCALLNEARAKYLIIGGYACILHGHIRSTKHVDILVPNSDPNFLLVREALAKLEDGAAKDLSADDFHEYLVLTVNDEVQVDISRQAWKVTYDEAVATAESITVNGVLIPFVSIDQLLRSKSTYRAQDQWDCSELRMIQERKRRDK